MTPEGELGQLLELMHTIDHNDLRWVLEPVRQGGGQGIKEFFNRGPGY